VQGENGISRRNTFASRSDNAIVFGIVGQGKQTAELSFNALPPANEAERKFILEQIRSSEQGVKDGHLYFRTLFTHNNPYNSHIGYEGVGRVVATGGRRTDTATTIQIVGADEILVLIEIHPLLQTDKSETAFASIVQRLAALPADYAVLQARHAKVHRELMTRVSFSLDAPAADRAKTSEQLNQDALTAEAPLAKIERAFDAARYNILCCTGYNPPNLQGLWSGTWRAPWSADFTGNGNLPCAVAFLMMGNTPELMTPYFRLHNRNMPGFRENAKAFYGMRGFRVPCHFTTSSHETDFSPSYPMNYGQWGAPWLMANYFDYFRYTGDRKFLEQVAYPLMKEACAYFEDFLTLTDDSGKAIFVPSYSPENAPGSSKNPPTCINATMDVACTRQLLTNSIAAAKLLGTDPDPQAKWAALIEKLPEYQVGPDGSFREWLWPGLAEDNEHRHASHLYGLFDGRPQEIVGNPALISAVEHTIQERLKFRKTNTGMAFGVVQLGLAATHLGNRALSQQTINILARGYWSDGMASFHNWLDLFNMDISGGFPYLCASSLVYAEPGSILFFPAKPEQWPRGSLKGVRLRGGILLKDLSWNSKAAWATLISDTAQTVTIEAPGIKPSTHVLRPGKDFHLDL
jgi:alpha-L-fucosidase 2